MLYSKISDNIATIIVVPISCMGIVVDSNTIYEYYKHVKKKSTNKIQCSNNYYTWLLYMEKYLLG